MAYASLEPFGEERADLRSAIVASVIANANRDPDKHEPFTFDDFMPKFDQPPVQPQTWEQQKAMMIALTGKR